MFKNLKTTKSKPCKVTWSSLLSVACLKPDMFTTEHVVNAMVNILRRDIGTGLKTIHKSNSHVHQMFLNLICHAFADKDNWPEAFVKVCSFNLISYPIITLCGFLQLYVEDAIGDRIIIDSPYAKPFVDNVITAFHTKVPPSSLLKSETWTSAARDTSSPLTINNLDEDES